MRENSSDVAADIVALLRARNPLIWVVTGEEGRVEPYLFEAAAQAGYIARTWDCGAGTRDMAGKAIQGFGNDPAGTLEAIFDQLTNQPRTAEERACWIMRDLTPWLQGPIGMPTTRWLKNVARALPGVPLNRANAIIVLTSSNEVPPELTNMATVVEWPLPTRDEIGRLLDSAVLGLPDELRTKAAPNGQRQAAIDAAVGLSGEEVSSCYARSLVQLRRIDPAIVHAEKKRVIAREGTLQWYDPILGGLDAVGGLDLLKGWLREMALSYTPAAREYGLPAPKGVLVIGVTGCGKSLVCKATCTSWGVPLLKADLNATKDALVGASEQRLRRMLKTVGAVGRCGMWIDELEKVMAGGANGAADGGVSADQLGTMLSWMQDREGEAFMLVTANDIRGLPPELLRKGRFDEVFFVDLPTHPERIEVLQAGLREHRRFDFVEAPQDWDGLAEATDTFTGSEIVAIVPDAMRRAYADGGRQIEASDLIAAAQSLVPIASTMEDKITELRNWAKTNARPATSGAAGRFVAPTAPRTRMLDIA